MAKYECGDSPETGTKAWVVVSISATHYGLQFAGGSVNYYTIESVDRGGQWQG